MSTEPGTSEAASRARRPAGRAATPFRGLLPLVGLLIIWQLVGGDGSVSAPPPDEWLTALGGLAGEGVLQVALGQTLSTFALGLALATASGVAAGAAIGSSRRVDRALTPLLDFVASVPSAVVVPVAVLLLGINQLAGVSVVALAVVWPVLLNTAAAVRAVPAVRIDTARTLGLSGAERLRKVLLPSLLPGLLVGIRVAAAMALVATLLVDIVGTGDGIGRLLVERQQQLDGAGAWGLLLTIGTVGYLVSAVLGRIERQLLRHRPDGSGRP